MCSTGLIGVELPMALIRQNIGNVGLNRQGGNEFARAIMTTDTRAKELAVTVDVSGRRVTVGGAAKGVGDDPPRHGDHARIHSHGRGPPMRPSFRGR